MPFDPTTARKRKFDPTSATKVAPIDTSFQPEVQETTARLGVEAPTDEKLPGLLDLIKGISSSVVKGTMSTAKATAKEFKPGGDYPGKTIIEGVGKGVGKAGAEVLDAPVHLSRAIMSGLVPQESEEFQDIVQYSEGLKKTRKGQEEAIPPEQKAPFVVGDIGAKIAAGQKLVGGLGIKKLPSATLPQKAVKLGARSLAESTPFAVSAISTGDPKKAAAEYAYGLAFDAAMAGLPVLKSLKEFMDAGLDQTEAGKIAKRAVDNAKKAKASYKAAMKEAVDLKAPRFTSLAEPDLAVLHRPMAPGVTPFPAHMAQAVESVRSAGEVADPLTRIAKTKLLPAQQEIGKILSNAGAQKGAFVDQYADVLLDTGNLWQDWTKLARERLGMGIDQIPTDPGKAALVEKVEDAIRRFPDEMTLDQADQARQHLRSLYENDATNAVRPRYGKTESSIDKLRDALTVKMKSALEMREPGLGDEYMELNKRYAQLAEAEKMLRGKSGRVIGEDGIPLYGPNLLKAASSSNYGPGVVARELFDTVKQETGVDLLQDAQYAQLAMRLAGIPRSTDLLAAASGGVQAGMPGVYSKVQGAKSLVKKGAELVKGDPSAQAVDYWTKLQKIHAGGAKQAAREAPTMASQAIRGETLAETLKRILAKQGPEITGVEKWAPTGPPPAKPLGRTAEEIAAGMEDPSLLEALRGVKASEGVDIDALPAVQIGGKPAPLPNASRKFSMPVTAEMADDQARYFRDLNKDVRSRIMSQPGGKAQWDLITGKAIRDSKGNLLSLSDQSTMELQKVVDSLRENPEAVEFLRGIGLDEPDHIDTIRAWISEGIPPQGGAPKGRPFGNQGGFIGAYRVPTGMAAGGLGGGTVGAKVGETEEERKRNAAIGALLGMIGGGALGTTGLKGGGRMLSGEAGQIGAFHGSPHRFSEFGPLKDVVGTGEGAQAFGHGL